MQKALTLIAGLMLCLPLLALGQVKLGIGAGLNFEELRNLSVEDVQSVYEQSSGYHIGAFLDIGLGSLALRPGVYYLNAGALFQGARFLVENELPDDFEVRYIAVPADVRLRIPLPLVKPYVFGGPELRYYIEGDEPDELKDDMQGSLVLGNVGAGVQISLPILGLDLYPEFRYAFGITKVTQQTVDIGEKLYEVDTQRFRTFMLRLGVAW